MEMEMKKRGFDIREPPQSPGLPSFVSLPAAVGAPATSIPPTPVEESSAVPIVDVGQRFSIPVLAPPRSAYFVCYSYRFRCLFYSNASALRSGHHRIFRQDSSSKRTYIFHLKCI